MAREAILRDTKVLSSRRYTCATSTGTGDPFIGFAHADVNKSTDTSFNTETSITADKGGMYELVCSGGITVNKYLKTAAPGNYVMEMTLADMSSSLAICVGIARETGVANETINVEVLL